MVVDSFTAVYGLSGPNLSAVSVWCFGTAWIVTMSAIASQLSSFGTMHCDAFNRVSGVDSTFTLNKFECSKQA